MKNRFKNEEENQNLQNQQTRYENSVTSRSRNATPPNRLDDERSDRDESRYGTPRNETREQYFDQNLDQSSENYFQTPTSYKSSAGRPGEYSAASPSHNQARHSYGQNYYSQPRQSSPSERQNPNREDMGGRNNSFREENQTNSNGYASSNRKNGQNFDSYQTRGYQNQFTNNNESYGDQVSQGGYYTHHDGYVDQNFSGGQTRNLNEGGGYPGNYEDRPETMQSNPPSTFGTYSNDIQNSKGRSGAQYQSLRPGTPSYRGKGPKGYKRSDERIKEDVCESFHDHHDIDASDIDVEVKNGEVTLSGTVLSRGMKRLAEDTIEGLSGVKEVINNIRLAKNSDSRMNSSPLNERSDGDTDSTRTKLSSSNQGEKSEGENDISRTKLNNKRETENQKPNNRLS